MTSRQLKLRFLRPEQPPHLVRWPMTYSRPNFVRGIWRRRSFDPLKNVLAGLTAEPRFQSPPRVHVLAARQPDTQPVVGNLDKAETPVGVLFHDLNGGFLTAQQNGVALLSLTSPGRRPCGR